MRTTKIKSYKRIGQRSSIDIEVDHPDHNFYAEDLVTSNCKGHAYPYSYLTYVTAYLKIHHTREFYCASLIVASKSKDPQKAREKIQTISTELPLFGMRLLPPDLVKSQENFSIEGSNVRFGLRSVKGISEKTAESLNIFRGQKYSNKFDVFFEAKESGLNIGNLCSLIQAGCLDSFDTERSLLVLEAQVFNQLTAKEKPAVMLYGQAFNYDVLALLKAVGEGKLFNDKGKPLLSEKRLTTLREKYGEYRKLYNHNNQHRKFCNWYFEKQLLGYSYTHTLRDVFMDNDKFSPILEVYSMADRDDVRMVGVVTEFAKSKSKKNDKSYLRINLSDETGKTTLLFFDKEKLAAKMEPNSELHPMSYWYKHNSLKEDDILVITGKKSGDVVFVDSFKKVDTEIFMKVSKMKD